MEQRYTFHVDPDRPSEEQIARHRDFQAVLARHRASSRSVRRDRNLRRVRRATAIAAALALLVLVPLLLTNPAGPEWSPQQAEAHFAGQPLVNPPLPKLDPVYRQQTLRAEESHQIRLSSQATLNIPADAFADASGQAVRGDVLLKYRQMNDPVDFFLAGIPMHYDSAGQRYQLESAGMVEVLAEQEGRPLRMRRQKPMQVQLVSQVYWQPGAARPEFNIYYLDTAKGRWIYQEPARQRWEGWPDERSAAASELVLTRLEDQLQNIQQEARQGRQALEQEFPLPEPPAKPYALRPDLPTFELDLADDALVLQQADGQAVGPEERRRLQEQYANTTWQVAPQSANVDTRAFNVQWQGFRLQQLSSFTYRLTLVHEAREQELLVHPVLTGEALARAKAEYQAAQDEYEQALAQREARIDPLLAQLEDQVERQREQAWSDYRSALAKLEERDLTTDQVATTLQLSRFGIWNVDYPVRPKTPRVKARFVNAQGSPIQGRTAWLADRAHNTVFRYYAAKGTPLHLDPDGQQVLWVVTENGRLAVLRREDLDNLASQEEATLVLEEVEDEPESPEALREILRI